MESGELSEVVSAMGESPTLAVTEQAQAIEEAGGSVVGFGAGEPDFQTPERIVQAARDACSDPKNHKYTSSSGLHGLREAVAQDSRHHFGTQARPSMVTVAAGAKSALTDAFRAVLDAGDEVLIPAPHWVSYPEQIRVTGARPVVVDTQQTDRFRVSVDQLESARTDATTALVLTTPSNPTGTVYPRAELESLGQWAVDNDCWIIADEIYARFTYRGAEHVSLRAVSPDVSQHAIVVSGVSKTYAMTGWRLGWSIAPPNVADGIGRLRSHTSGNVTNVAQAAAIAALEGHQKDVARMHEAYDRRRELMVERLNAMPGVSCLDPEGAFYAFPDLRDWIGRRVHGTEIRSTEDLAELLLEEAGVAVVPGEAFGAPGFARMSYAAGIDHLAEGLDRMEAFLE